MQAQTRIANTSIGLNSASNFVRGDIVCMCTEMQGLSDFMGFESDDLSSYSAALDRIEVSGWPVFVELWDVKGTYLL